jgi:hypothetical protein
VIPSSVITARTTGHRVREKYNALSLTLLFNYLPPQTTAKRKESDINNIIRMK